jgi:hypothetical protein
MQTMKMEAAPEVALQAAAPPNGTAWAAILAAGIGSFAMGLFVILNEAAVFAAPALYAPAGGVSGRTTFAMVVWLGAWALLHWRWRGRTVSAPAIAAVTTLLVAVGVLATFPPLWSLLQ